MLKLTTHGTLHCLWSEDLSKSLSQLTESILLFSINSFCQYYLFAVFFSIDLKMWGYPTMSLLWFIKFKFRPNNSFKKYYLIIMNLCSTKQKQKISDFTTITQKDLDFAFKKLFLIRGSHFSCRKNVSATHCTRILFSISLVETLTLSWRRPLSYRNQSIDLQSKSMDWFLYGNSLRHEWVNMEALLNIAARNQCSRNVMVFSERNML